MIMRKEDILSKGTYVHSQVADLVCVKQYIVAKFKNKKALFLRFSNDREEIATAMTLRIRQYDVRGEFICAETIEVKHLKVAPHADFTVKNPMIIKDSCIDFRVDIINVSYGDYTYDVIDGEAHVRFAKQEADVKKTINTNQLRLALDGKSQRVAVRSLKAPTLLVLVCSVLLLSLLCFSIGQLALYMYTETCFTLDNFEYEFLTDNKDDGPIRLTKYNGFALNLIIPAEIEGYEIAAVADTAFAGTKLRSITFEGNTEIEDGAFENCVKLHTVKIKNVEEIGKNAFKGCESLKNLTIGESLRSIGDYAFSGCTKLESIELCEGLESVGKYAFEKCSKISELTIPTSTEKIGYGVVSGCNMSTLTVPFIGTTSDDGIQQLKPLAYLYGESDNANVRNALVNVIVTDQIVIPDGMFENCVTLRSVDFKLPVTGIGNNAFKGCKRINTFEIDDTVEYIGENAFYECFLLDGIVIPDGIERIEAGCFYGCKSLSSIVIPDDVRTIGKDAFKLCTSLKTLTVPKTVTTLEEGAFADCTSLIEVTIPFIGYSSRESASMRAVFGDEGANSIKAVNLTGSGAICEGAFENMTSLERVYLNAKITSIGQNAFSGCTSLAKVTMSDKVNYIGDRAFYNCASLDNLDLPTSLGFIGESVFEGCSSLSDVSIPENITEIRAYAFAGCSSLAEVIWPDTIENIGEGAFKDCSSLMAVNIPLGVTNIENYTFENCSSLTLVAIAADVSSIGERAFAGCSSLQGIALPNALERIENQAFADCVMLGVFSLPTSVTELGGGILEGCTSLDSLTVHFMSESFNENRLSGNIGYLFDSENADNNLTPDSLTTVNLVDVAVITDGAFTDCSGLYTVNLPQSLTTIEAGAFKSSGIVRMIIPEGVTVIEESTFENCERLTTLTLPRHLVSIEDKAFSGCCSLEAFKLYNMIESIGEEAFFGCESLASIEIPKSVKTIGESALEGCISLETIVIPFVGSARDESNTMSYVLGDVEHTSLKKISVTDATQLPEEAFKNLTSVEEITLPKEMYTIGDCAFLGCSSLKSIEIPSTVTYIGLHSLKGCESLESLTLPFVGVRRDEMKGITNLFDGNPAQALKVVTVTQAAEISEDCFINCEYIEKIVIDTVVESIGANAFRGCSSLREITMPDTVKSIGDCAFSGCSQLRSIVLPEKLTDLSTVDVFKDCYKLFEIYNRSSSVTVLPESGEEGSAGYYALNVYAPGEQPVKVSVGGFEFLKQNNGSAWYLIDYAIDDDGDCAVPAEFSYNGATIGAYYVPAYLFYMDDTLVDLSLTSSVVGIGEYAFYGCTNLTSADIASTRISDIAVSTFEGCVSLEQMTIPYNVTNISDEAFKGCYALERVEFPEALIYIGREAFYDCATLNWVKVQEYVWEIGMDAFYGCVSLDHVYNLSALQIEAGETTNGYVAYYALLVDTDQIVENLHVVEIGELVFKKSEDRWFLIGHNSTDGSLELDAFTYQNRYVDSYVIINGAFAGDDTINKVVFSNAVKRIGIGAFDGCNGITEVDFTSNNKLSLSEIDWITNLSSLNKIGFPRTLTLFPSEIVGSFTSLEAVSFAGNANITSIPSKAFNSSRSTLKTVVLPDCVEIIEADAFTNCTSLENITMSDSITTIGDRAFRYCRSLRSVYMPYSLVSIGENAFEESAIESLTFKSNVNSIGRGAFKGCASLKNVDMSSSMIYTLTDYAFMSCTSLETIELPANLTSIGEYAFSGCYSLVSLDTPSSLDSIGVCAFNGCNSLESVALKEGLDTIGAEAFRACSLLESITVPSTVSCISNHAFADSGLKSVTLLGCEVIEYGAFINCYELISVSFSSNIMQIGDSAFTCCDSLSSLNLASYRYLETIGNGAFMGCTSLKNVNLSNCVGLEVIDYNAFNGCTGLQTLNLSNCTNLREIRDNSFASCGSLNSVNLTSCRSLNLIGEYSFRQCESLETLTFTGCTNLTTIGDSAFRGCSSLEKVNLSMCSSLNTIGSYCFGDCTSMESFTFPSSLSSLGTSAFRNCEALKAVDLSVCSDMTVIPSYAFEKCTSLESLILPTRVSSIGSYAFSECSSLEPIRIPATLSGSNIGNYAFYGCEGLYEIWCESQRSDLVPGGTDKGYLAYYAIVIHYSYSDPALNFNTLTQNGVTYKFAIDENPSNGTTQRYLIGAEGYNGSGVFQFPTVATYTYTVSRWLANEVTFSSAYVPTCVQGFEAKYLSVWGRPTVYYKGSYDAFGISGYCSFYTYVNCKHQSGYTWYNTSTNPLTNVCGTKAVETKDSTCTELGNIDVHCTVCNELLYSYSESMKPHTTAERVVIESTCTREGKVEIYCTVCGTVTGSYYVEMLEHDPVETVHPAPTCTNTGIVNIYCNSCNDLIGTRTLPMISHEYDQNNVCKMCGHVKSYYDKVLEESLSFESSTGYTFTPNGPNEYVSSNKGVDNSRCEMTFTAKESMKMTVIYSVSSESGYDHLIITLNGEQIDKKSGSYSNLQKVMVLNAGDVVTFVYSKDVSQASGNDAATIHSIVLGPID